MNTKTLHVTHKDREIRAAKQGSARDAIGHLTPDYDAFILTFGQFSLIDAISTILEQTGPANVAIATWTAADAHLEKAENLLTNAEILSMKWLVDRSFVSRKPEYCQKMRTLFGDDCIRTLRSHAKFAVVTNSRWNLAIRTSMNLNENPRLENLEISNDERLSSFLLSIVDDVFSSQNDGIFDGKIPALETIENVERKGTVSAGVMKKNLKSPSIG